MRAVRIHGYGGPDVLLYESDVPEPGVAPDAVLIRTIATSVNPIDWKVRSGARQKDFPLTLPAILGRDVSGVVSRVGSEVTGFAPGDRVIAFADACYADLVAVPQGAVAHLPDGLDPVHAAALPLVCATGEQLVRISAGVQAGQVVLVSGALGSVGRAAVHAALALGARVIAGVRSRQLGEAEALGASATVALDDENALDKLGVIDAVADTVGGKVAADLLARVRPGGRFGYASVLPDGAAGVSDVAVSRVFARPDAERLRWFAEALRDGAFALPVSRQLPLSEVARAHERLEQGGGGKVVLTV